MTIPFIIIGLGAIGVCALVYCKLTKRLTHALFVKTGVSVLFMALAAYAATRTEVFQTDLGNLALFILIGLTFGLLGDIWLDLKDVHKDSKRTYMYAGFSSFGIGHIFFFIGLFVILGNSDVSLLLWPAIGGAFLIAAIYFSEKPLKMQCGEYRPIVLVYSGIICATTVMALMLALSPDNPQPEFARYFTIGMVLFLLSDLVLSQTYFSSKGAPDKIFIPLNYLLYYGGQFVIAYSMLTLAPA